MFIYGIDFIRSTCAGSQLFVCSGAEEQVAERDS